MKIRMGFVSNSSSSSFVVARQVIGEEMFAVIESLATQAENDDYECTFNVNKNYISGSVSHHSNFVKNIAALNLPSESYLMGD